MTEYQIGFQVRPKWFVGWHIEKEELFLFTINDDGLVGVYRRGGLDSLGFVEFMNFDDVEVLGEL